MVSKSAWLVEAAVKRTSPISRASLRRFLAQSTSTLLPAALRLAA